MAEILMYEELESTSTTAKEMARNGIAHGTTIIADRQTAGRGRYNRSFHSPGQTGIYMSTILHRNKLGTMEQALITIHAAVAVCEAINEVTDKNPQIKWVNDIFLDSKKICGILVEAVADAIIVGIGVNFCAPRDNFPPDLQQIAGAIFTDEIPSTTRNHLSTEILARLTKIPASQNSRDELIEKYRQRLFMLGKRVIISRGGAMPCADQAQAQAQTEATALDINNMGHLIVQKDSGEILTLNSGEVSIKLSP